MKYDIAVIIPTLDPSEKICTVADQLYEAGFGEIIVVNDGSGDGCRKIFEALESKPFCRVLHHSCNKGKGAALKTAFMDYLLRHPDGAGCITADDDGQHRISDIVMIAEGFSGEPDTLWLGCRNFLQSNVPWKSRIGNLLTRAIFRSLAGISISDTQTGLRAMPRAMMENSLAIRYDRFEFETAVLLCARENNITIREKFIETVYIDNNSGTHFRPFRDAALIYGVIFRHIFCQLFRFVLSGMSSALIDALAFTCFLFVAEKFVPEDGDKALPLLAACCGARLISATWNFLLNRYWVFATDKTHRTGGVKSALQYAALCCLILLLSYKMVWLVSFFVPFRTLPLWKLLIDTLLFILSFLVQKHWVFRKKNKAVEAVEK